MIDLQGGASTTLATKVQVDDNPKWCQGGACTTLEVNCLSLIHGKEGGIQVLAGRIVLRATKVHATNNHRTESE
jgi:hypothetical protein